MKDCADVAEGLGLEVEPGYLPRICCWSCHEDDFEGYYPLIDSGDMRVCCSILREVDDAAPEG